MAGELRREAPGQAPDPVLLRFLALYGALFTSFGAASPFLPALLGQQGLTATEIGIALAAGGFVRLLTGPAVGRLADRLGRTRAVMVALAAASAVVVLGYRLPGGFPLLVAVAVLHSVTLSPVVPLADALALGAAPGRFNYGWVRAAGSAAFVVGATASGQVVERFGLSSIVAAQAALLAVGALAGLRVPDAPRAPETVRVATGMADLLRVPGFLPLMVFAALIQASHAVHDGFAVIRWREAGIGAGTAGILWSEGVVAEVVMFALVGPPLLRAVGVRGAALLVAGAGILRWCVMALTAALPAMALAEPLHGFTFALMHLTCMGLLGATVPPHLAATAQAAYHTVALSAVSAVVTLGAGPLYGWVGAGAFWAMAALCAAAVPAALLLPAVQPAGTGKQA